MDSGWSLPKKAFQWIEENIAFGSNIVELGSGHGSIRLTENYHVWSVEHDKQWLNISPSNYIHAEITPYSINGKEGFWYNPEKIKNGLPEKYSLLIIDGPPSRIGRYGVLDFQDIFNWDCHILVDDTHRAEDKLIADELTSQKSLNQKHFTEYFERNGTDRKFTVLSPVGD